MPDRQHREGMKAARLLMVLSSISPLFALWASRRKIESWGSEDIVQNREQFVRARA